MITVNAAFPATETAATEGQHRAAASFHFAEADKAKAAGDQLRFEAHDSAGAVHLAAADRPKMWRNTGDSYEVELAHMKQAADMSADARWASRQANKLGNAKVRSRKR